MCCQMSLPMESIYGLLFYNYVHTDIPWCFLIGLHLTGTTAQTELYGPWQYMRYPITLKALLILTTLYLVSGSSFSLDLSSPLRHQQHSYESSTVRWSCRGIRFLSLYQKPKRHFTFVRDKTLWCASELCLHSFWSSCPFAPTGGSITQPRTSQDQSWKCIYQNHFCSLIMICKTMPLNVF